MLKTWPTLFLFLIASASNDWSIVPTSLAARATTMPSPRCHGSPVLPSVPVHNVPRWSPANGPEGTSGPADRDDRSDDRIARQLQVSCRPASSHRLSWRWWHRGHRTERPPTGTRRPGSPGTITARHPRSHPPHETADSGPNHLMPLQRSGQTAGATRLRDHQT